MCTYRYVTHRNCGKVVGEHDWMVVRPSATQTVLFNIFNIITGCARVCVCVCQYKHSPSIRAIAFPCHLIATTLLLLLLLQWILQLSKYVPAHQTHTHTPCTHMTHSPCHHTHPNRCPRARNGLLLLMIAEKRAQKGCMLRVLMLNPQSDAETNWHKADYDG